MNINRLCSVCHRPGHSSSDCPSSVCTLCNMLGHKASVCPDNDTKSLFAKVAALERGYRSVQGDPETKRVSDALFLKRATRLLYHSTQAIQPMCMRRVSEIIVALDTPPPVELEPYLYSPSMQFAYMPYYLAYSQYPPPSPPPFPHPRPKKPVNLDGMTCAQVMKKKKIAHTMHIVKPGIECDICYNIQNAYVKFRCGHEMCAPCAKPYIISTRRPACHMCRAPLSV
jgi:hypothetical protein